MFNQTDANLCDFNSFDEVANIPNVCSVQALCVIWPKIKMHAVGID